MEDNQNPAGPKNNNCSFCGRPRGAFKEIVENPNGSVGVPLDDTTNAIATLEIPSINFKNIVVEGTSQNDLSKGIRSEINDKNSVLSIESLNAYVHNEFFYHKADNLIIGWDNIETFFVLLWESINKE